MSIEIIELIVIGGGPAGASAAIRARALGLDALLIDEGEAAGGQVYRAAPAAIRACLPPTDPGEQLRARLSASGARCIFGKRVWHAEPDGTLIIGDANGIARVRGKAVIVATGATERFHPFPGWTLPGVVGLAAATAMIKAHGVLPGRRVLVAGPGPLAPLVASLVSKGGGRVVGLVEPTPLSAWLSVLPAMATRVPLAARGAWWIAQLKARGTPIWHGARIEKVVEESDALRATIIDCATDARREVRCDAVCAGAGLEPSPQLIRLLGAALRFDPDRGGWVPEIDESGRTSVRYLYAAGDGVGIRGAEAAPHAGELAAIAAALDLGRLDPVDAAPMLAATRRALAKASRFGAAMARLMAPSPRALSAIPDTTIVCRCEDLTAGTLREAIAQGARSLGALKSATRCGMGPCGGRVCGEGATALIEECGMSRAEIPPATTRSPLRPMSIAAIAGSFAYSDVPLPEPSPA